MRLSKPHHTASLQCNSCGLHWSFNGHWGDAHLKDGACLVAVMTPLTSTFGSSEDFA